jgi:ubiquinone/menaquinone biosynthesis C-methylase UbiE
MTVSERLAFGGIRLMHETLYGLLRDADRTLRDAGLAEGMKVLEVGCGPGFFTLPAARRVGEGGVVCAIDLNPYAVEYVRQKVARDGVANVTVVERDAAATGFPQGSYDLAFLFGLRRAIGGMDAVLRETYRVLRPSGVLATEGPLARQSEFFEFRSRRGRISVYSRSP